MKRNADRERLDSQRTAAARYFAENYSREQRYLIVFARDFAQYLASSSWLKSEEAKQSQKFYDFFCDFEDLKSKMKEFSWSADFLKENGIDFREIRRLYFAVA